MAQEKILDEQESIGTIVHTLSSGDEVRLPPHNEYYAQFVTRNSGLVSEHDQELLRSANILVAGCGSVGGAVVEPLVRFGAEHLELAEPDTYDLHNINRQSMRLQDIGRNKAEVQQGRMHDLNPYATINVHPHGITDENVERLCRAADVIIDGVDVTTKPPLFAKYALHAQAKRFNVPVIAGYDIAGLQLLYIYDYRNPAERVLHNRVREEDLDSMEPMEFLRRVIPIRAIPYEIIPELQRQMRGEREGFPQIVYTANLFGVITVPAVLEILAGRPIRRRIIVDVPTLLRPTSERMRILALRLRELIKLYREANQHLNQPADVGAAIQ